VASSLSTWLYGALAAAVAAIILSIPSIRRGSHWVLDWVTIVFFVGLTIAGIVVGAKNGDWMDTYATTVSSAVLAAVALGSLAFVPFTEQYARESTPPELWDQPAFKRTNRILSLAWGLVFAALAVCGLIATKAPSISDWTNWVIPIVLIVAVVKFTQIYPDHVRARAQQAG
jgi:MFS family permease